MLKVTDLNGPYKVVYSSLMEKFHPDFCEVFDLDVMIKDGSFSGVDHLGRIWSGTFIILPEEEPAGALVKLRIDPQGSTVWHYDGEPKREPIEHEIKTVIYSLGNGYLAKGTHVVGPVTLEAMIYPLKA